MQKRTMSTAADPFAAQQQTKAPFAGAKTTNQFVKRGAQQNAYNPRRFQQNQQQQAEADDGSNSISPRLEAQANAAKKFLEETLMRQPVGEEGVKQWHHASRLLNDAEDEPQQEELIYFDEPTRKEVVHPKRIQDLNDAELYQRLAIFPPKLAPSPREQRQQYIKDAENKEEFARNMQAKEFAHRYNKINQEEKELDSQYNNKIQSQDYQQWPEVQKQQFKEVYMNMKETFSKQRALLQKEEAHVIGQALLKAEKYKEDEAATAHLDLPGNWSDFVVSPGYLKHLGGDAKMALWKLSQVVDKPKNRPRLPRVDPSKAHLIPEGFTINDEHHLVPPNMPVTIAPKFADQELYVGSAQDRFVDDIQKNIQPHFKLTKKEEELFHEFTSTGQHLSIDRKREKMMEDNKAIDEVIAKIPTRYQREKSIDLHWRPVNISPYAKKFFFSGRATCHAYRDIQRARGREVSIDLVTRKEHKPITQSMDMSFLSTGYYKATH
eukprot:UN01161